MLLSPSPWRSRPLGLATIAVLLGLLAPGVSHASAMTMRPGATATATVRLAGRAKVLVRLTAARCGSSIVIREGGATVRRRLSPHRSATVDLGWMSPGAHDVVLREHTYSAACRRVGVRAHLEIASQRPGHRRRPVTSAPTPPPATSPVATATATATTSAPSAAAGDPLAALPFYVSPGSEAAQAQAQDAAAGDTADADLLSRIADEPEATWLNGGTEDASAVADTMAAARSAGQMPVFVLLFLAPVYVPLNLLAGWIHDVARFNPVTPVMEAGRGLLAGSPTKVLVAFASLVGAALVFAVFSRRGLAAAERAG